MTGRAERRGWVGAGTGAWHQGQEIVITSRAKRRWRAAGKLRPGRNRPRRGSLLGRGAEHGIAPAQAYQGEMAMQPGPTTALVVAEPQPLLAIFMEAFQTPA